MPKSSMGRVSSTIGCQRRVGSPVPQPSALPSGKRGALMREAARPAEAGGGARTLVYASLESWDSQHAFPSAKVRISSWTGAWSADA